MNHWILLGEQGLKHILNTECSSVHLTKDDMQIYDGFGFSSLRLIPACRKLRTGVFDIDNIMIYISKFLINMLATWDKWNVCWFYLEISFDVMFTAVVNSCFIHHQYFMHHVNSVHCIKIVLRLTAAPQLMQHDVNICNKMTEGPKCFFAYQ